MKDTDELMKFRRQWMKELEMKQHEHGHGKASDHASLTGTPDHTPPIRRKDKEEEVRLLCACGVSGTGC